ncbi:MAG: sigma-70 family RNA polymerase sigma factor [Treponema sp.]|nr:sigma-70 family RNA polymerase sigma factor [Treponema sp.]
MPSALRNIERVITQKRDFALIKSTLDGNNESFSKLVSLYKKKIRAIAFGFFKNEDDIEDFTQEVFLKVFEKLNTFKGESSFYTWITRVAYNIAINSVNRKKTYINLQDETILEDSSLTPEEKALKTATIEALHEALKEIDEKYAICLDLFFFHDMSQQQISDITGFTLNTIKSHIFRAKKILKEKLRSFYE